MTMMLERAARALYEFGMMADCPSWDQFDDRYKNDFFDMARAVLMAVREPDDIALDAACVVGPDTNNGEFSYDDSRTVFIAMIDAILSENG